MSLLKNITLPAICALVAVFGAPPRLVAESAAGLKWTAPAGWVSKGPAPFRIVTYAVPATSGPDKSECIVYFFGPGQGGTVEANMNRWKSQFTRNGRPSPGTMSKELVHGITVTMLDISGVYAAGGGMAQEGAGPSPDYRMIASVAEGPGGNIFIRFIGPAKSVAAGMDGFRKLVGSLQRQ